MFNLVQVFTATKHGDRDKLGDAVTHWIDEQRDVEIVDRVVVQSSDREYHCLSIVVFCIDRNKVRR